MSRKWRKKDAELDKRTAEKQCKDEFYKINWMCVGMALILTLVLMMEPDGPKKEIMLKIRDYTDILPAYGYQGWLSSLFDGLGYWFGVLWSVFHCLLHWHCF